MSLLTSDHRLPPSLRLWHPLEAANCLLDGRPAAAQAELWRRLHWPAAFRLHTALGTALQTLARRTDALDSPPDGVWHTINPDRLALALEPGEYAVPIAMPTLQETPVVASGWLWLVGRGGEVSDQKSVIREVPPCCPRPVVPMPEPQKSDFRSQ